MTVKLLSIKALERTLRQMEDHHGRKADAIIPLEIGGINSTLQLVLSAKTGIPVIRYQYQRSHIGRRRQLHCWCYTNSRSLSLGTNEVFRHQLPLNTIHVHTLNIAAKKEPSTPVLR